MNTVIRIVGVALIILGIGIAFNGIANAQDQCVTQECVKKTVIVKKEVIKPQVNLTLQPSDAQVFIAPGLAPVAPAATVCQPGRAVGASLGLVSSIAAMAVGAGFTYRGFAEDTTRNLTNKSVGIGAAAAGVGGFIPSIMAIKRNRDYRETTGCAKGHFRK